MELWMDGPLQRGCGGAWRLLRYIRPPLLSVASRLTRFLIHVRLGTLKLDHVPV